MGSGARSPSNETRVGIPGGGQIVGGKYRVGRVLGAGGMGVVVAARHLQLARPLAIKFLRPDHALNRATVKRLVREARAAAAITSEHVSKVMDVGTLENGAPYIVMERLFGQDLGARLKQQGRLSAGEAVDFLLQACEALAEAHARGIVHRDLKPTNLFVTARADGSPLIKVLDFGIAKDPSPLDERTLTGPGKIVGSPQYMSPEQLKNPNAADARSDVWALGVVLYRLVTNQHPFAGESVTEVSARIAAEAPVPIHHHLASAPSGLDEVVSRCLEKDPGSRFQSVADLARALEPLASPEGARSIERIVRLPSSLSHESQRERDLDTNAEQTEDYAIPAEDRTAPAEILTLDSSLPVQQGSRSGRHGATIGRRRFFIAGGALIGIALLVVAWAGSQRRETLPATAARPTMASPPATESAPRASAEPRTPPRPSAAAFEVAHRVLDPKRAGVRGKAPGLPIARVSNEPPPPPSAPASAASAPAAPDPWRDRR